jgi:hypothetical protein
LQDGSDAAKEVLTPVPRIFVLSGPDVGLQCDASEGAVIGRGDDCAVRLRDASVSRHHARFERGEGGLTLVDLGSRNGIACEGVRAERIPLTHGVEFVVGAVRMRFTDAAVADVEEIELEAAPPESAADASASTMTGAKVSRSAPEIGAARRRALATKEGILQFERVEGAPASVLRDDLGQYGPLVKLLGTLAALAVAGALGFGAYKIAVSLTPEGGKAAEEVPAEVK